MIIGQLSPDSEAAWMGSGDRLQHTLGGYLGSVVRRHDRVVAVLTPVVRWSRSMWSIAVIYFLGVSPGRYQAIIPTFIVDWDARRLGVRIAFGELAGATATATAPDPIERRYALHLVKQRLHQAAFRDLVLAAYDHRCAIGNLPDDHLLDAAHIMADAHELLGQPVVANGIALSKIRHAAFAI